MALIVNINDMQEVRDFHYEPFITGLLEYAYQYLNIETEYECSVILCDNDYIQTINNDYRNINKPTDVLSFAVLEWEEEGIELGDIFISIEKVIEQANEYGHSFERELAFLALHGFLHLLGYDHMNQDDESEMFSLQTELLDSYQIKR